MKENYFELFDKYLKLDSLNYQGHHKMGRLQIIRYKPDILKPKYQLQMYILLLILQVPY